MIPVTQTTFGHPGGNCFSACIASLFEMPIDDIPYFMSADDWQEAVSRWLRPRGWYMIWTTLQGDNGKPWYPEGLYIMGGKSARGDHAVVARGSAIIWDPHPSRDGLVTREDANILLPLDPAARLGMLEFPAVQGESK